MADIATVKHEPLHDPWDRYFYVTEQEEAEVITKIQESSHIPFRLWHECTFELFQENAANKQVLVAAKDFCIKPDRGQPIFFTMAGGTGTGKTHLAIAMAHELILKYYLRVLYYQCEALCDWLLEGMHENHYDSRLKKAMDADVLIIDDLGAQKPTEWKDAKLDEIIDHRYAEALSTIITTNAAPKDISARVVSRINSNKVYKIKDIDHRIAQGKVQREEN